MRKRVLTLWDGKVVLALLILAGCIITAFSAYRQIYVKMPDYAAKQIIRSVQDATSKPSAAMSTKKP